MPSLTFSEIQQFSKINPSIFVETGTFMGDTVEMASIHFNKVISIELSEKYASDASMRFQNIPHVTILQGDSSAVLPDLCKKLDAPTFFWLDGHWSGADTARGTLDCPLLEEICAIHTYFSHECVIAIDDIRLFETFVNENWSAVSRQSILHIVKDRLVSCEYYPSHIHSEDRMVIHLKREYDINR